MNPKHIEKIADPAHAPYNFIELPEDIVKAEPLPEFNCYHQNNEHLLDGNTIKINRHTGRIECTLITKSPLYTRSGWSPEDFAEYGETSFKDLPDELRQKRANFSLNPATGEATIFGSSLRGILRTLIEIVSFSKIDRVTDKKLFYRSIADGKNYTHHFIEESQLPHRDKPNEMIPSYHAKVHTGFLRKQGNSYIIEECGYGRINFDIEDPNKSIINTLIHSQLYQGKRQLKTPIWQYQNKTIYVNIDDHEEDHLFYQKIVLDKRTGEQKERHPDIYLRFRKVHSVNFTESPNLKKAKLVITGDMQFKHLEFVFLEDDKLREYPVSKEIIARFQDDDQVTKWQATAFPKDKPFSHSREQNGYFRDGEPVFFLLNDDGDTVRFLGRAQMFRLPYENSPLDFVPPQLRDTSSTDIAEAIFGYVNGKVPREKTCASRVFITDGILKEEYKKKAQSSFNQEPQQILLSSPKPTTFQHYLVQPKETQARQHNLKHYASKPPTKNEVEEAVPGETVIRGHKLYWHKPCKIEVPENADTQTSLIKPLDPDIEFTFKIYFENLSDVELGALLWILDKAEQPEYCLSLGMGKPLGMGTVKLKLDKLCLDDRQIRYKKLFAQNNQWELGERLNITTEKQNCIRAFENYVLQKVHTNYNPKQTSSLEKLRRIEMLLIMLQCNSLQNVEKADYMTLDAHRKRPVLPNPLQVVAKPLKKKVELPKKKSPSNNVENTNSTKAWERPKPPKK